MRRLLALLLICSSAYSQQETGSLKDEGDFVVRINVNLVQVDAVVTDARGTPVTGLTANDFEVFQDGVAQPITNFGYVAEGVKSSASLAPANRAKGEPSIPAPPVPLKREQVRRAIVLMVDDLGLSFTGVAYVHTALKEFVDHDMQPGDMVAIVRTGAGVGALQQFTTDKQVLYAAIDHIKINFMARAASFSPIDLARSLEGPSIAGADATTNSERYAALASADACLEDTNSAIGSLAAIRYVVQGLRDMPGRKALVLLSESMQVFERPDQKNSDRGDSACDYSRVRDILRRLTDAAERSAVVIYTIDPHGLDTLAPDASSNPFAGGPVRGEDAPQQLVREQQERENAYFWSQGGLQYLAKETGGTFAFHNDTAGAIRDAINDSGNYYLIGYRPPASTFESKDARTKFHRVTVRVKHSGLKVRSRTGFYGFPGRDEAGPNLSTQRQFARVLSSPFAENDIHLRITTFFSEFDRPILTTFLYIDTRDLTFTTDAAGDHKAVLNAVAVTFDENDAAVDNTQRSYTFSTTDKDYALAVKNGAILTLQQVVRRPGPYQVRVAIRDAASGKMGSANKFLEVPNLKRQHLALSGILLKQVQNGTATANTSESEGQAAALDPKGNEAIRIFKPGETIGWYYQIFNAKSGSDERAKLKIQVRLFRDGLQLTQSQPVVAPFLKNSPTKYLATSGHLVLDPKSVPGDYALQLIVTDELAKKKYSTASQWIDFEVENP